MKALLLSVAMIAVGATSFADTTSSAKVVDQYANVTKMTLDPHLPEPFARTTAAQVILKNTEAEATLIFIMDESEGIEVTFPITSDMTDACNVRTVIATPPSDSTPYAKDFEIKVVDYSNNTCKDKKVEAPTVATLTSYEVQYKSKTFSSFLAEKLAKYTPQQDN